MAKLLLLMGHLARIVQVVSYKPITTQVEQMSKLEGEMED